MYIHSLSYVPFENLDYLFGLSRRQFALGEVKRSEEVSPITTIGSTTSCTMVQNLELNIIMTDES